MLISKDKHVAGRVREHVEGLEAEVNVLRRLDHPNIVRYLVSQKEHLSLTQLVHRARSRHIESCWADGVNLLFWQS